MRCCSFVVFLLMAWLPVTAGEKNDWLSFPTGFDYNLSVNHAVSAVRIASKEIV